MASDDPPLDPGRRIHERVGTAGEVVGAALYFASAASSYTTGAIINIDGGVMP